ncbi:MAG: 3'(2'),5'-bisphosphate nucleotidase CysQ [Bacteroidota bacterium]|nr:3'(2'),5'-bisphosphate nucleotidase CysQ [Bacteroidota bacterium]
MNDWINVALKASLEAGQAIMDIYESDDVGVEYKEDASPLTRADRAAHHVILRHLEPTGIPVLSEEGKHMPFEDRSQWDELWIVDPVDGTKEFIKRNGEFTVNIALVRQGRVAGGVVLAPVLGHAYVGVVGEGAWRLHVSADVDVDAAWNTRVSLPVNAGKRAFTVVASRSHMSPETQAYVEEAKSVHGEVNLISKGSSLKLCMVAEGTADAYPRFAPTMEWDTAAGQAVCEAAGCDVIDQNTGAPMRYNREDLLNAWFLVARSS